MKLDLSHTKVAVIGLARSGMAAVRLLKAAGAEVFVSEAKQIDPKDKEGLDSLGIEFEADGNTDRILENGLIVVSPGVRRDIPVLKKADAKGIEVIGEIELAYRATECPIVAVTGTNGKSTTVSLIGAILEKAGKKVFIGGNLAPGKPLCQLALEASRESIIVAEISTFQIETIKTFRPYVGVITNISPDHLDRHPDFETYARLKGELLKNQRDNDWSVQNYDDENVSKYCRGYQGRILGFSLETQVTDGAWWDGQSIKVSRSGKDQVIMDSSSLKLPGHHNIANALAAVAAVSVFDISSDNIAKGLSGFKGVPHRLEEVAVINDVRYINNSMCTNNAAGVKSLAAFDVPLVVIAGGKEKGTDLSGFIRQIASKARATVLIGEARKRIGEELTVLGFTNIVEANNMKGAVEAASQMAKPGDIVILAPGCASFDMFKDFEDRGEQFRQAVKDLEKE
jgi:UDP-N-acetylmuramoylalanine--D-glutamate ligase